MGQTVFEWLHIPSFIITQKCNNSSTVMLTLADVALQLLALWTEPAFIRWSAPGSYMIFTSNCLCDCGDQCFCETWSRSKLQERWSTLALIDYGFHSELSFALRQFKMSGVARCRFQRQLLTDWHWSALNKWNRNQASELYTGPLLDEQRVYALAING